MGSAIVMRGDRFAAAVDALLDDGLDDWVSIDTVIHYAREIAADDGDFRTAATDLLVLLFDRGLVEPGRVGDGGFVVDSDPHRLDRVLAECAHFDWRPRGASYWLALTAAGAQHAAARRTHST